MFYSTSVLVVFLQNYLFLSVSLVSQRPSLNLPSSDDYNRVLLRTGEDNSQDSEVDDEEPEDSSDEEDEDSIRYINASHINVCYYSHL